MHINALARMDCSKDIMPSAESPSILDNLRQRKLRAEKDLANINAALEAMEKNPEVTRVLELIAKV